MCESEFNNLVRDMFEEETYNGFIRKQVHPTLPLAIYTYTTKTELEDHWNDYTLAARGLVLNNNRIVIPCIHKFFNIGTKHAAKITMNDPGVIITEKNDGYLIQIKKDSEFGVIVTSKGSFTSPMADKARELIAGHEDELEEGILYVCELCCNFPGDEGTIVTRWGDTEKLVCFSKRDEVGTELPLENIPSCLEVVREFTPEQAVEYLEREDVEGVVLRKGQQRVKVKTEHFLAMHRLISDIRKIRVWEILSSGHDLDEVDLPDEFMKQMVAWKEEMLEQINAWRTQVHMYEDIFSTFSDKELALSPACPPFYKTAIFMKRKNKPIDSLLWKHLREKIKEENKNG